MNPQFNHSEEQKQPKGVFFATFVVIFFTTMSAADSVGLVPSYLDPEHSAPEAVQPVREIAVSSLPQLGEPVRQPRVAASAEVVLPERIVISAISLDLPIQNPATRDIESLDALLKNGPARHVDSAKLGEVGTMIVFAHSSHLPVVRNKMYQAFNRVPELVAGDTITLQARGKKYLYSVTSLKQVDAQDATIDLSKERGTRLVLVTCDTLTGKTARYMLEADFIGVYAQ